jgi:hypothetical protein
MKLFLIISGIVLVIGIIYLGILYMKMDISPSDDDYDFVWMGHFFCMFPKHHEEDD